MLTSTQLLLLRTDLEQLANIEYNDVLNEQLDHYASLTETKMANGLSFDDASKWAWSDMGGGEGILAIQADYIKNIQRQVERQHLIIVKSYFRWPTFAVTALVAVLVYIVIPMLPADVIDGLFWAMVILPIAFVSLWRYRYVNDIPGGSNKLIVKERLHMILGRYTNFVFYASIASGGIFDSVKRTAYYQAHTTGTVILCLLVLLYTISVIQLYSREFTYQPETA